MGNIRRRALVRGRVQGVGFRYWTRTQAERLGVSGWVLNRSDGTVEVEMQGDPSSVAELLEVLSRGPAGAAVSDVDVEERPLDHEPGFHIRTGGSGWMSGWFRRS